MAIQVPKAEIGSWHRDGFNLSAIIRKISDKGLAGEWETIALIKSEDWDTVSKLMSEAKNMHEALKEISLALGPRKADPIEHADAIIDNMQGIALRALTKIKV